MAKCVDALAVLGFGTLSLNAVMTLVDSVAVAAQDCQNYLISFVPVFSGVAAVGGQTAGALVYSGMFLRYPDFYRHLSKQFCCPSCRSILLCLVCLHLG